MKLKSGETILFIGDSITDCGRRAEFSPFGNGYVSMWRNMMLARHPEMQVSVVNRGISGDTVRNLKKRWPEDVLAPKPEWLVVKVGINDVMRAFSQAESRPDHVPLDEFRRTYQELLLESVRTGIENIVLCSPFYVEPNGKEPARALCDRYREAVAGLADHHGFGYVDMQAVFLRLTEHQHPVMIAGDRVHPSGHGHQAMADALYGFFTGDQG